MSVLTKIFSGGAADLVKNLGGVLDNQDKEFIENYSSKVPLKRMANESEYNGAIQFLISSASSYVTGSNMIIDGGWTAW